MPEPLKTGTAIAKALGEVASAIKEYIKSGNARYYRRTIKQLRTKNQVAEDFMDADEDLQKEKDGKKIAKLKRKKDKLRSKFRASKV
jgi:predicted transcriptional regulator